MKYLLLFTLFFSTSIYAKHFNKDIFWKSIKTLQKTSYHKLSDDEIYKAAIEGVLAKLEEKNGKNSNIKIGHQANKLLVPRVKEEITKETEGAITGIGAVITFDRTQGDKLPLVIKVLPGGAQEAGIKKGDYILKIGKTAVDKFDGLMSIIYKIRGKEGSKVTLSILRGGDLIKKTITRKKISYLSTESKVLNNKIGHLKIRFFNKKTYDEITKELNRYNKKGINKVILDLRGCPGGLLKEGLNVVKLFAKKNDIILKTVKAGNEKKIYTATKDGVASKLQLALLVDRETASMAEVLTSMIKSNNRGIIIGEQTFGKGTMETILDLTDGYAAKYTTGKLFNSKDVSWANVGITPDIALPTPEKNKLKIVKNDSTKINDYTLEIAKTYLTK